MIGPNITIEICSSKSEDDWGFGVPAPEVDDGRMTAPSVQSKEQIIRLTIVRL
jgi:hypothetical protein